MGPVFNVIAVKRFELVLFIAEPIYQFIGIFRFDFLEKHFNFCVQLILAPESFHCHMQNAFVRLIRK